MSFALSDPKLDRNLIHCILSFPDEIERHIFRLASRDSRKGSMYHYLLVAKQVHHWLEPLLYQTVDLYCQPMAESFISSLQSRPAFAKTTVKVLHLRLSVTPEQGAKVLQLCQGLQELTLKIIANLPDNLNPLCAPLNALQLTTVSLDLASAFYGPMISLSDFPLLNHIERLHLANGWVAQRGLYIGLHELHQLTHISFPVQPPGQRSIHTEVLAYILCSFHRLRVVILWRMPYQESRDIYDFLEKRKLVDCRIVIFNAAKYTECAQSDVGIWKLAEVVVQWREDTKNYYDLVVPSVEQSPIFELLL